jgi:cytochrome c biogenesis protein
MKNTNPVWKFFVSVKLTVFLLLSLAGTSVIGTVIPQNADPEIYFHKFGSFLFRLFEVLDVFDMYHAWWFHLLLFLLIVNIVVCSIDRLAGTWKLVFPRKLTFNLDRFEKQKKKEQFSIDGPPDELEEKYSSFAAKRFGRRHMDKSGDGFVVFAEKGRWTRLGVYVVHLSVILLIIGAIIGSLFGFKGFVNIPEGESVDSVRLRNNGRVQPLGFTIHNEDFDLSFYDTGAPKEFRSTLTILENDQPVVKKDIIVNDPLRYKGVSIFMASYGEMAPKKKTASDFSTENIHLNFTIKTSGMVYKRKAEIGKPVTIPEGLGTFTLVEFNPAAEFRGQNIGAALTGMLSPVEGAPVEVLLPLHFPNFDKMRRGAVVISVADQEKETFSPAKKEEIRYYSGLEVNRDPGVWVVYSGFVIMIVGCFITFFLSHQQICIKVMRKGRKSDVRVMGMANKNKIGMQRQVEKMAEHLAKMR